MLNPDFQDFFDSCIKDIVKENSERASENLSGNFKPDELVVGILSEASTTTLNYLAHYHDWLCSKYDLIPKKND